MGPLLGLLLIFTQPIYAEESAASEKIRDISPDGKFAMRICDRCRNVSENVPQWQNSRQNNNPFHTPGRQRPSTSRSTINKIELVSLPQKRVVAELHWDGSADQTRPELVSRTQKWCAFHAETARMGSPDVSSARRQIVPVSENVQAQAHAEDSTRETWGMLLEIQVEGDVSAGSS